MTSDWSEGPATKVADGVFRIPLPLPGDALKAVNVYAIDIGAGIILIDAGWALASRAPQPELIDGLGEAGYSMKDIRQVLVTHIHRDHYTQAATIRELSGARIFLGVKERPSLEMYLEGGGAHMVQRLSRLRAGGANELADNLVEAGAIKPSNGRWEYPDDWIFEDIEIVIGNRRLLAVQTPGHTRGHVSYYEVDAGLLFAGDHVLPHITPSIGFEPDLNRRALADYLHSLRRVLELPDALLLPAHGEPTASVHQRASEILEHHRLRLASSLDAVHEGALTALAVATVIPWTRRNRSFDSLAIYDRMLAVSETAAHLDVLHERGSLTSYWVDGVCYYSALAHAEVSNITQS